MDGEPHPLASARATPAARSGRGRSAVARAVWLAAAFTLTGTSVVGGGGPSSASNAPAGAAGASPGAPCDGLDLAVCMLPFPNDYYTAPDPSTPTGRRVDLPPGAFPAATGSAPFDPTPWAGNDGFSPGSTILAQAAGVSVERSGMATLSDIGRSLDPNSPVVVVDASTGVRTPVWAELDSKVPSSEPALLLIHPAADLTEGHRYLVALRDLRTATGAAIPPGPAFREVLGPPGSGTTLTGTYAAHLRQVVAELGRAGVTSRGLYLAWDFTVDSRQNLTGPALAMRNRAFGELGSGVPAYRVTRVTNDPPGLPSLARQVSGTFEVPSFLTGPAGVPGPVLAEGADGLPTPVAGRVVVARFRCGIPRAASSRRPATVGVYGHGLFNSADEVYQSWVPQFSDRYDYVFCGTDWTGLSASTVQLAASVVSNLATFPSLADNLMQALVNAQFLGRLLDSPKGLAEDPAFRDASGRSMIRTGAGLVYYGNSEGGIMGGAFTALSTDTRRSVLGVTGMDYDLLLPRSSDFQPFQRALNTTYPSRAVQQVGFDLTQMLWDRGETDGYVEQMTGGLPATPDHQVMLEEGFGDHQVANVSTETEARTIRASLRMPALPAGRSGQAHPFWGLAALVPGSGGPALTVWDAGVPPPPSGDTPPTAGNDPHGTVPRALPAFWAQMNTFFTTGRVVDPCGTHPCRAPYPPRSG